MKKFYALFALLLVASMVLSACTAVAPTTTTAPAAQQEATATAAAEAAPAAAAGAEAAVPAPAGKNGKPVVGLVMKSLANEFFKTMEEGAVKYAKDRGDFELVPVGMNSETDIDTQINAVENFVTQGVDLICLAPADSVGLVAPAKRAIDAGITVVNFDVKLDDKALADAGLTGLPLRRSRQRGRRLPGRQGAGRQAGQGRQGRHHRGQPRRRQRQDAQGRLRPRRQGGRARTCSSPPRRTGRPRKPTP